MVKTYINNTSNISFMGKLGTKQYLVFSSLAEHFCPEENMITRYIRLAWTSCNEC